MKDYIIIGGGIVGLATAYHLLRKNPDKSLVLLEKEENVSQHQTGHNSGVIHSGLYYKPGSLKAKNCIEGYHKLLNFCDTHEISYELCGKIVVSTHQSEEEYLQILQERGRKNGLDGIIELNKEQLKEYEPHVSGTKGLYVPQTGIIDYTKVAYKLKSEIEKMGGEILLNRKVTNISLNHTEGTVFTEKDEYTGKKIINCAGLFSDKIARMAIKNLNIKIIPFRGEYYKLKEEKEYLVKNLIYPVPNPNFPFLGVHFTRMMKGGVEAGPNAVLAFQREGYKKSDINIAELIESLTWPGFIKVAAKYWKTGFGEMYRSFSKAAFTKALQNLIPELTASDLIDGGSGVRAQACDKNGGLIDDFLIFEEKCMVNVCNAPSPAATSSLSIGDTIAGMVVDT